jgi:hypothetical protein
VQSNPEFSAWPKKAHSYSHFTGKGTYRSTIKCNPRRIFQHMSVYEKERAHAAVLNIQPRHKHAQTRAKMCAGYLSPDVRPGRRGNPKIHQIADTHNKVSGPLHINTASHDMNVIADECYAHTQQATQTTCTQLIHTQCFLNVLRGHRAGGVVAQDI